MNQPKKFNTHEPTQLEVDHLAILDNPNMERMFSPDQICDLIGANRLTFSDWVRVGTFPPPDLKVGNGVRSTRRWWPATVFGWIASRRPKPKQEAA